MFTVPHSQEPQSLALTLERVSKELACSDGRTQRPVQWCVTLDPTARAPPPRVPLVSRLFAVRSAEIGKAFVTHYYQMFDASIEQRSTLQAMYQDASMLTFENEQFLGMQAIMTKLTVRLAWG